MLGKLKVFAGRANPDLADRIARCLGDEPGRLSVGVFPDGESQVRIDEDVRGRDIYVVQPTCPPVNQNLMELLILLDAFKRASATRVTAVLPYYGYARQDRKDVGRVPITAKLVADLLESAGADRVLALDLHAAQIQGFFDIPVDHLYASPVLCDYIRTLGVCQQELVVLSPDEGSIKKALAYQKRLGGAIAVVDKRRCSATEVRDAHLIGASPAGKVVMIFDDIISTAGTLVSAAEVAAAHGAREVYAFATHGVFADPAPARLRETTLRQVVVTDSIPVPPGRVRGLHVLGIAPILAEAIKRIHLNKSVSELFA